MLSCAEWLLWMPCGGWNEDSIGKLFYHVLASPVAVLQEHIAPLLPQRERGGGEGHPPSMLPKAFPGTTLSALTKRASTGL